MKGKGAAKKIASVISSAHDDCPTLAWHLSPSLVRDRSGHHEKLPNSDPKTGGGGTVPRFAIGSSMCIFGGIWGKPPPKNLMPAARFRELHPLLSASFLPFPVANRKEEMFFPSTVPFGKLWEKDDRSRRSG